MMPVRFGARIPVTSQGQSFAVNDVTKAKQQVLADKSLQKEAANGQAIEFDFADMPKTVARSYGSQSFPGFVADRYLLNATTPGKQFMGFVYNNVLYLGNDTAKAQLVGPDNIDSYDWTGLE